MKDSNVKSGSLSPGSTSRNLVVRLRTRDPEAWSRLAKLYGPLVYGWCRRRGLKAEDAADIVQEVFRAIAEHVQDFEPTPTGSFRGWLWTITRNKMLDHHRRRQRQPDAVGGTEAQQRLEQLPEALDESEPRDPLGGSLVRRALDAIRPDFSETSWRAFWEVVIEEKPAAEVANRLGVTVNAVYIARSRILQRLRDELGEAST